MRKRYPIDKKEQERRAKLIAPFFQYLKCEKRFLDDVEDVRIKYGISNKEKGTYEIPLYLLNQKYWRKDINSMAVVKHYGPDLEKIWAEFHMDIEELAAKYLLKNFLDLFKEFIMENRFGNALLIHHIHLSEDGHTITLPRSIQKKEFNNIWKEIDRFNKDYPIKKSLTRSYTDEIIEKYKITEKIQKKNLQVDGKMFMKEKIFGSLGQEDKRIIEGWDKSKKSRLLKQNNIFFSLVHTLNDTER